MKKAPTGCLGTTATHSETVPETQLCPWEEASSCGTQTQSLYRDAFLVLFLLRIFCLFVFFFNVIRTQWRVGIGGAVPGVGGGISSTLTFSICKYILENSWTPAYV